MESKKKYYKKKIVKSGNMIEVYVYENPVSVKRSTHPDYIKPVGRAKTADEQGKIKNREATIRKAKQKIVRRVHANCYRWADENGEIFLPIFMTLTFGDYQQDVKAANAHFRGFIKRLNYRVYKQKVGQLKYIAVVEFQKNGTIHYHCVFFNLPFVPVGDLEAIWRQGSVHASPVRHVGKTANYLVKQLPKTMKSDRLAKQKCYLSSNELLESESIIDDKQIEAIIAKTHKTYEADFTNEFYGKMHYERRSFKRKKK